MKLRLYRSQREPGFRLNAVDVLLGAIMAMLSIALSRSALAEIAALPVHAFLTFFCFCNVFRIGRRQEVVWWLTAFCVLIYRLALSLPPYPFAFFATVPTAVVCIVWAALNGRYHGICHVEIMRLRSMLARRARS